MTRKHSKVGRQPNGRSHVRTAVKSPSVLSDQVEMVNVDKLEFHPENPRQGDIGSIVESIDANGFFGTLVVQRSTARVLVGNHRLKAAIQGGLQQLPVQWIDVDDDRARRILLVDNRTNDQATYDDAVLAAILRGLVEQTGDLTGTGYDGDDLDQILADLAGWKGNDGEVLEPPTNPRSRRGEVYELGPHRLMCGDATSAEDVAVLLGGATPNLLVTDPPYGVNYDPAWRQKAAVDGKINYAVQRVGRVSNDDRADWSEAWGVFPGDVIYSWHPAGAMSVEHHAALLAAGFEVRMQIIWVKPHMVISRGHYHVSHEPCWYAVRKGKTARWIGDRTQRTVWEVALDRNNGNPHGTAKPIELMERPIRNHAGDVYDPFVGSGTTIIAADRLGRTCYAMDIDPAYCDVARDRWARYQADKP